MTDSTNSYTTTENKAPSNTRNLETIKDEIRSYQETSTESYLEIGRLLLEAKEQFGKHGEWLEWLQNNVDIPVCKAQRLMRVARWMDGNEAPVPHLDFTKAYILSRLTGDDLKRFLQKLLHVGGSSAKQVETMTKRELELAVRNHLKQKRNNRVISKTPKNPAPPSVPKDNFLSQINKMKEALHDLADYVAENEGNSDNYELFTKELCDLCTDIVQQLSSDAVEDD